MPKPKPRHNRFAFYLVQVIDRWVWLHKLGMIFFDSEMVLDEINDLVYAPDLQFDAASG